MIDHEEWRAIPGWEGLYEASSLGRVRSLDREILGKYGNVRKIKGRPLKALADGRGYHRVNLCDSMNDRTHFNTVHRIIGATFIPNPSGFPDINHKDGVKTNNAVDNLEWCTASHNSLHAAMTRLQPSCSLTDEQAAEILWMASKGVDRKALARAYNMAPSSIRDICERRTYSWVNPITRPTAQAVAVDSRKPSDAAIAHVFRQACAADLQWAGKRTKDLQWLYDLAVAHDESLQAALEGR